MTIQEWLIGNCTWEQGVALYEKWGNNINLKRLFKNSLPTDYLREKLKHELQALEIKPVAEIATVVSPPPVTNEEQVTEILNTTPSDFRKLEPKKLAQIDYEQLPPELKLKYTRKGELYKQSVFLKVQMGFMTTDEKRYECAEKIVMNRQEIDGIWAELDYWAEHNQLMPNFKKAVVKHVDEIKDRAELINRRNNLRSSISKNKNKPQKHEKVKHWRAELEIVEKKLNNE